MRGRSIFLGAAIAAGGMLLIPGVAAAVARAGRPLMRAAARTGATAYDEFRRAGAEAYEHFEDIAAEMRAEAASARADAAEAETVDEAGDAPGTRPG